MIRLATHDDIQRIVDLGADFLAYSPHRHIPLDREAFAAFAGQLIDHGAIFLSAEGMIGGLVTPVYFNPAVLQATELFWWAPSEGRALREAFEAWAVSRGVRQIIFTGLVDEHAQAIARIFARAGYRPVETGFVKDL